jgi:hypothetical protein
VVRSGKTEAWSLRGALAAAAIPSPGERNGDWGDRNEGAFNAAPQLECCELQYRRVELGTDVAEAQIRLFRREGLPVLSQLWDLYGEPDESVVEDRTFHFGVTSIRPCRSGSGQSPTGRS